MDPLNGGPFEWWDHYAVARSKYEIEQQMTSSETNKISNLGFSGMLCHMAISIQTPL